jgi:hypothetical protein
MPLNVQQLKVSQTALPLREHFILVSNINIPQEYLIQDFDAILTRTHRFIVQEYTNIPNVQFQVCATYTLQNRTNGQIRTWTGSFNPRGNIHNTLNQFQPFGPNFFATVRQACSEDNIYQKLRIFHADTNWVFEQLVSIYINVQGVTHLHHPTISKRSLANCRRHGKTRRINAEFYLP